MWEGLQQVYMPAADTGELPIRVFAMVPLTTWYSPSITQFSSAQHETEFRRCHTRLDRLCEYTSTCIQADLLMTHALAFPLVCFIQLLVSHRSVVSAYCSYCITHHLPHYLPLNAYIIPHGTQHLHLTTSAPFANLDAHWMLKQ